LAATFTAASVDPLDIRHRLHAVGFKLLMIISTYGMRQCVFTWLSQ